MISYSELQKTIFDFSYGTALGDAIGQKAFEGRKKPLRNNEDAKSITRQYIDDIVNGKSPNFYKVVAALQESFTHFIEENKNEIIYIGKDGKPSNPVFRFGNAQKLINMLAKNMFLLVYQNETLRERFAQCHCPMDNIMIATIKKDLKRIGDKKSSDLLIQYKNSEKSAWSRIEADNHEQYDIFQTCVKYLADKQGLSPIEYDYWRWKNTQQIDAD